MAVAPQNIMAQLRGMPDAQLAKYAAMHKNDPFIFPLAFQESQTRKQLRASKDLQMVGQQQPKVVDQDLQQMMPQMAPQAAQLPEDIGIAQLPAQNLTRMAGGGIVAFEEGGYVPRFSGVTDGSSIRDVYNMTPEEIREQAARKLRMEAARAGLSGTPQAAAAAAESPGFLQSAKNALGSLRPAGLAGWGFATHVGNLNANEDAELKKRWAESDKYKFDVPESTIKGTGDTSEIDNMFDKGKGSKGKGKGSKDSADATKPVPRPSINPNATANKPGAGAPAQNAAAPTADSGLSGLAAYVKEGNAYTGPSPLEGQKARLDKQEAQDADARKEAFFTGLGYMGLKTLAGKSQYALQNIGEGGEAGLSYYTSAMKDLRQAAKERDKMRNELENAAYAYKRDDVKGYQTHMEKAQDRAADLQRTQMQVDATLKAAQTTAGAHLAAAKLPPREAQMAAMLGTGSTFEERFQSGLPKLTAIQAGKFDPRKAYSEYLVAAQRANTGEIMPYAEFAMQFAPRVSGGQGQVLPRAD